MAQNLNYSARFIVSYVGSSAVGRIKSDFTSISRTADRTSSSISQFQGKWLALGAVFGATSFIKDSLDTFREFDLEMAKVRIASGATSDQLESLRKKAIIMGRDTEFSAKEVATAFKVMGAQGIGIEKIPKLTPHILNLTTASQKTLSLEESTELVLTTLRKFNKEIEPNEAKNVVDYFTGAAQASNFDFKNFRAFMNSIGTFGNEMNTSVPQALALGGALRNIGQLSAQSGNTLAGFSRKIALMASTMIGLGKPMGAMKGTKAALDALGIKLKDFVVFDPKQQKEIIKDPIALMATFEERIEKLGQKGGILGSDIGKLAIRYKLWNDQTKKLVIGINANKVDIVDMQAKLLPHIETVKEAKDLYEKLSKTKLEPGVTTVGGFKGIRLLEEFIALAPKLNLAKSATDVYRHTLDFFIESFKSSTEIIKIFLGDAIFPLIQSFVGVRQETENGVTFVGGFIGKLNELGDVLSQKTVQQSIRTGIMNFINAMQIGITVAKMFGQVLVGAFKTVGVVFGGNFSTAEKSIESIGRIIGIFANVIIGKLLFNAGRSIIGLFKNMGQSVGGFVQKVSSINVGSKMIAQSEQMLKLYNIIEKRTDKVVNKIMQVRREFGNSMDETSRAWHKNQVALDVYSRTLDILMKKVSKFKVGQFLNKLPEEIAKQLKSRIEPRLTSFDKFQVFAGQKVGNKLSSIFGFVARNVFKVLSVFGAVATGIYTQSGHIRAGFNNSFGVGVQAMLSVIPASISNILDGFKELLGLIPGLNLLNPVIDAISGRFHFLANILTGVANVNVKDIKLDVLNVEQYRDAWARIEKSIESSGKFITGFGKKELRSVDKGILEAVRPITGNLSEMVTQFGDILGTSFKDQIKAVIVDINQAAAEIGISGRTVENVEKYTKAWEKFKEVSAGIKDNISGTDADVSQIMGVMTRAGEAVEFVNNSFVKSQSLFASFGNVISRGGQLIKESMPKLSDAESQENFLNAVFSKYDTFLKKVPNAIKEQKEKMIQEFMGLGGAFATPELLANLMKVFDTQIQQPSKTFISNISNSIISELESVTKTQVQNIMINAVEELRKIPIALADMNKELSENIKGFGDSSEAINQLKSNFVPAIDIMAVKVTDTLGQSIKIVNTQINDSGTAITSMKDKTVESFNTIANSVDNTLQPSFNRVIVQVQDLKNELNSLKTISGISFSLNLEKPPGAAKGGIVPASPGGRLVTVGEGGSPEAIIPLDKFKSFGGGGQTINDNRTLNFTINVPQNFTKDEIQELIIDAMSRDKMKNERSGYFSAR